MDQSGSSWQDEPEIYHSGAQGPWGLVNLSPAWFQQGHDVSVSTCKMFFSAAHSISENIFFLFFLALTVY
jgi:hypothetical protein